MTDICGRERNSLDHSKSVLIEAGVIRKKITDHTSRLELIQHRRMGWRYSIDEHLPVYLMMRLGATTRLEPPASAYKTSSLKTAGCGSGAIRALHRVLISFAS